MRKPWNNINCFIGAGSGIAPIGVGSSTKSKNRLSEQDYGTIKPVDLTDV